MLNLKKDKKRKKHKKRNLLLDYLVYLALRFVVGILHLIGIRACYKLANFLGTQLWLRYQRGRDRAIENLKKSFPDKDADWINNTGQRSFQQLVMLVIDILWTPRLVKKGKWRDIAGFKSVERLKWMMAEKKGILLATAHYGNFEIMGYLLGMHDFEIYSVARPLDNKFINKWLYSVREKHGQKIIDKKGASAYMGDILQNGAALGFIADQDAGKKGMFVDFFGRKASTYKSIGLIAINHNMPIAVGYSRRIGNQFKFEMCCSRIIKPYEWQDKENPLEWITAEYTKAIEDFIREEPAQYWWLHRRWKHRPRAEKLAAKKAAQEKANNASDN